MDSGFSSTVVMFWLYDFEQDISFNLSASYLWKLKGGRPDGLSNMFHLWITMILTTYACMFSLSSKTGKNEF